MSERMMEFPELEPEEEESRDRQGELLPLIDRETFYDLLMEQQEQM